MTHDEAVELIRKQMEALPEGTANHNRCQHALANGINLRVSLRTLAGMQVCWAITEHPLDDLQNASWHLNFGYNECTVFRDKFNKGRVVEKLFTEHVAKVLNGLNEYRDRLGLSLDVWEVINKLNPERRADDHPEVR